MGDAPKPDEKETGVLNSKYLCHGMNSPLADTKVNSKGLEEFDMASTIQPTPGAESPKSDDPDKKDAKKAEKGKPAPAAKKGKKLESGRASVTEKEITQRTGRTAKKEDTDKGKDTIDKDKDKKLKGDTKEKSSKSKEKGEKKKSAEGASTPIPDPPKGKGPLPAGDPEVGNQTKVQHLHTEDVRRVAQSLASTEYYHGFLPRDEIENMLKKNGNYLLRATEHANERRLAVSVLWEGKPRHVLLNRSSKGWWFLAHTYCMPSIDELINMHREKKIAVNVMGAIIFRPVTRSKWQLLHEDIKEKKKMGQGAFGEVWSGTLNGKQQIAIKKMRTSEPVTKEQRKQFVAEARLMRQLDHDNIVRVLGVAANEEPIMLVMELLTGGSLLGALRNKKDPPTAVLQERFIVDACRGMVYLEMKKFIHRDLAARNCLLNEEKRVKISDFGLSLVATGVHKEVNAMKVPVKWLAPEVLNKMLYSHKSDVWAFGVMAWEVYTLGKEPYTGMTNAETKTKLIGENYRMPLPSSMPKYTQKLVTDMWLKDPILRPTFEQMQARLASK